jgi:hypothetical protein
VSTPDAPRERHPRGLGLRATVGGDGERQLGAGDWSGLEVGSAAFPLNPWPQGEDGRVPQPGAPKARFDTRPSRLLRPCRPSPLPLVPAPARRAKPGWRLPRNALWLLLHVPWFKSRRRKWCPRDEVTTALRSWRTSTGRGCDPSPPTASHHAQERPLGPLQQMSGRRSSAASEITAVPSSISCWRAVRSSISQSQGGLHGIELRLRASLGGGDRQRLGCCWNFGDFVADPTPERAEGEWRFCSTRLGREHGIPVARRGVVVGCARRAWPLSTLDRARAHDGSITREAMNLMRGADATVAYNREHADVGSEGESPAEVEASVEDGARGGEPSEPPEHDEVGGRA